MYFVYFWKNEKYICDNISKENMEKYEQYDMLKENIWFYGMTPLGFLLGTKKYKFLTLYGWVMLQIFSLKRNEINLSIKMKRIEFPINRIFELTFLVKKTILDNLRFFIHIN